MANFANVREKEERETRLCINQMTKTMNRRIQENIFPHWRSHKSLRGWSCMSFPSVLKNKKDLGNPYKLKQPVYSGKFSNLRTPVTALPLTQRRPISREQELKTHKITTVGGYAETFLNKVGRKYGMQLMSDYRDVVEENKKMNMIDKFSSGMLTTYTYEEKKAMIKEVNKKSEAYFSLRPNTAVLGPNIDPLNSRKVKQLDEIHLDNEESDEEEETYACKVNSHITNSDSLIQTLHNLP